MCQNIPALCSTGQAANSGNNWICPATIPLGAVHNGAGERCYNTYANCSVGPNRCVTGTAVDCVQANATCSTGEAGGVGYVWFCPQSVPPGAIPNGGGMLCYNTSTYCNNGPNGCGVGVVNFTVSGGAVYNGSVVVGVIGSDGSTIYSASFTGGMWANSSSPASSVGVYVNGSVLWQSPVSCHQDVVTCGSGQSNANPAYNWFCSKDYPTGSGVNAAGQLCYDSATDCVNGPNSCNANTPCQLDMATCATGAVSGTPKQYFCPLSMPAGALPQGGGKLCYTNATACYNAPNSCVNGSTGNFACATVPQRCATGQAANQGYNVFCPADVPAGGIPNGFGAYCYDTLADCMAGPTSCNATTPCVQDAASCATGRAEGSGNIWFCEASYPPGAITNSAGQLCYDSALNCNDGPNSCGITNPCTLDVSGCSTGPAASTSSPWRCFSSQPAGSVPNGGGALCYDTAAHCMSGTNRCNATHPCRIDTALCATGPSAGTNAIYICDLGVPPLSSPNGAGMYCYASAVACANGPNACNSSSPCDLDFNLCSTGVAGSQGRTYNFFCPFDLPSGAQPTADGNLCYDSFFGCQVGPNACNSSIPCTQDYQSCFSGDATAVANTQAVYTYTCPLSKPAGSYPTASGVMCYTSFASCMSGPNACGVSNFTTNCTQAGWFCGTGAAAAAGASWLCQAELPTGALPNSAGVQCYSTASDCHAGPSGCSAAGLPCKYNTSLCSTGLAATSSNAYVCPLSMPLGSIVSPESGYLCYASKLACLQGPNACNSTATCLQPVANVCPAGLYMCPLDVPASAVASPSGACYSTVSSCAKYSACGFSKYSAGCVTDASCPTATPFLCKLPSANKAQGFQVVFSLTLPSGGANVSTHTIIAQLAALLNWNASQLSITVATPQNSSASPAGRHLLAAVTYNVSLTMPTLAAATTQAALLPVVSIPAYVFGVAPIISAPAISGATVLSPVATSVATMGQLLDQAQATVILSAHLTLNGSAFSMLAGSYITVIGNTSACAPLGDPSGTGLCTIDGAGLSQHFILHPGASLTLVDLALINGVARGTDGTQCALNGGSVCALAATLLSVTNVSFMDCSAPSGAGGAIFSLGTLDLSNDTYSSVTAFAGFQAFLCSSVDPSYDNATGACAPSVAITRQDLTRFLFSRRLTFATRTRSFALQALAHRALLEVSFSPLVALCVERAPPAPTPWIYSLARHARWGHQLRGRARRQSHSATAPPTASAHLCLTLQTPPLCHALPVRTARCVQAKGTIGRTQWKGSGATPPLTTLNFSHALRAFAWKRRCRSASSSRCCV